MQQKVGDSVRWIDVIVFVLEQGFVELRQRG